MTDNIIKDDVQLAHYAADLLDTEARAVFDVVVAVQQRYQYRANNAANLDMLRDELLTKLAAVGILATVDPAPCFYGEPPIVEIIGHVGGVKPVDHEQKQFEVIKAVKRGEEYLGQKERANARKPKNVSDSV